MIVTEAVLVWWFHINTGPPRADINVMSVSKPCVCLPSDDDTPCQPLPACYQAALLGFQSEEEEVDYIQTLLG